MLFSQMKNPALSQDQQEILLAQALIKIREEKRKRMTADGH